MCSHYEAAFQNLLKSRGIPFHEWKNYADVYREWKKGKEVLGNLRAGIDPTKEGLVIKADGNIVAMRWGYMRQRERADGKGLKAAAPTVNARSEKIANPHSMWYESWTSGRRCIVPVSAFYEWTYPGGQMVTHRFHMGGIGFGVAGLWEDSEEFGPCYTMLTTVPNREVGSTGHDRCLVALRDEDEAARWLAGDDFKKPDFLRPDGMFLVESGVPNPRASTKAPKEKATPQRKKSDDDPPAQGELF
jgi:putative SOS response-associated peptidase YedK